MPNAAAWSIEQVIGTAPVLESVTTLAYAAGLTRPLRLGVAVLLIAQRNPIDLPKSLSSLDVLSNGRFIVGVGLGASTRHCPAYGLAPEGRVARFRENLDIIKRLWTKDAKDEVTASGRFSHLDRIPMLEASAEMQKPRPPIWFGGHAESALRRAVELRDGYMGAGSTPMAAFLDDIKQLPPDFPKAKRLYPALGDNLPRSRQWFGAFYGKPELADQVLLNPVFGEEAQMERLAERSPASGVALV